VFVVVVELRLIATSPRRCRRGGVAPPYHRGSGFLRQARRIRCHRPFRLGSFVSSFPEPTSCVCVRVSPSGGRLASAERRIAQVRSVVAVLWAMTVTLA
jgi:hypothetical protein